ncbi:Retrovirus-related Pol polyprotein from transposon TNT 1-94 [Melia azedarach]|uniref:Retrovirus-related Pol polyprotein from transposon TNT 1-94 n=1 Tax=Melia azedarach TaxID=155640 RepID=A0ACC1Y153_MELAZ|nr:Retrovirus-related Pol polyprotein from transposon TNT 1-94 [Melia azedarach]
MDVHNAFLHGDLEEEVYMKILPGFERQQSNVVCRMKKSLYGLKQAPRCWFAKLATALKNYGNDKVAMASFKEYLGRCFKMKDLGVLKYFLGLEVARSKQGIFICQRKYALDIISETGLLGAKPAEFPMEQNHKLALVAGKLHDDPEQYRRLIGRLIYLGVTRPDLAYFVHILSQFMQQPREEHWEAALRIVRYLKKNPGQGILLRADSKLSLEGWCDSDWASYPLTRRSLSGWFVLLGYSPVS